jgi:hypothetical protein
LLQEQRLRRLLQAGDNTQLHLNATATGLAAQLQQVGPCWLCKSRVRGASQTQLAG